MRTHPMRTLIGMHGEVVRTPTLGSAAVMSTQSGTDPKCVALQHHGQLTCFTIIVSCTIVCSLTLAFTIVDNC